MIFSCRRLLGMGKTSSNWCKCGFGEQTKCPVNALSEDPLPRLPCVAKQQTKCICTHGLLRVLSPRMGAAYCNQHEFFVATFKVVSAGRLACRGECKLRFGTGLTLWQVLTAWARCAHQQWVPEVSAVTCTHYAGHSVCTVLLFMCGPYRNYRHLTANIVSTRGAMRPWGS